METVEPLTELVLTQNVQQSHKETWTAYKKNYLMCENIWINNPVAK